MKYILIYLIISNIFGFFIMGIDKRKARLRQYRISEKSLFVVALLGGAFGAICGMYFFRHKTKHWYFVYGMPAILVLELLFTFFFFKIK